MNSIPASPYTTLFWNEFLINESSSEYNMLADQTIEGSLDEVRLSGAIKQMVDDYILLHHVLRDINGKLVWLKSDKKIELQILDAPCDTEKLVTEPFDLREGPLCRFYLIRLSPGKYDFLIIFHHVVIDGLSAGEMYDIISRYYNEGTAAERPVQTEKDLNNLTQHYFTEIADLKENHHSEAFWRDLLKNSPQHISLPYIENAADITCCNECRFSVSKEQWKTLKSKIKYANHFLIFKTLWALLIARQSGQSAIYIGYPIAPTDGEAFYFGAQVNTAIFPFSVTPDATFASLYQKTLTYTKSLKVSGKLRHSQLPTQDILSQSTINKLNVNFTQAYLKDKPFVLNGCHITVNSRFNIDFAGSDLMLEYQQTEDGFDFRLRFKPALFDNNQMQEMAEQYINLLNQVLNEPERPVSSFAPLTDQQQHRLQDEWLSTAGGTLSKTQSLLSRFEKQAHLHPNRIALKDDNQSLTYLELSQRVEQLAIRIRCEYRTRCAREMPEETIIPLLMTRGIHAITGILAILKAGGAYVPLDHTTPAQRLKFILNDVNSALILSETALTATHELLEIAPLVLCSDKTPESTLSENETILPDIQGSHLAYVIYTSGTTGNPKGTLCAHLGAVNMIAEHTRMIIADDKRPLKCLQFASFAFDAHVFEVFFALDNGFSLFIASEAQRVDPENLIAQMTHWDIDFCFLPPAFLSTKPMLPDSVRYLCVGGEATSKDILDHYLSTGLKIANMYGPTEASVSVSINLYRHNGARNIGRVIGNICHYVIDAQDNLQPLGVEGELCLAGVGLARGYLNQPDLTSKAFILNPFNNNEEYRRLYRTGDRVRRMADGSLEYCGRNDQQVKIHGYRIELGEIESAIRALPEVIDAVVAATPSPDVHIQAWYILREGQSITAEKICQQLSVMLPLYMLPSAFLEISTIPLTVSQKIDYKALPEPRPIALHTPYRAPETALEHNLQQSFEKLFNTQVGIDDHFFQAGGNSILAIKLCHEIYHSIGLKISVQTLHHYPTVALLSQYLEGQASLTSQTSILPSNAQVGPLSLQQSRLWFIEQLSTGATHYLSPVAFTLTQDVDCQAWIQSVKDLVVRHSVLRSLIRITDTGESQQYLTDRVLDVAQYHVQEDEVKARLHHAIQQPLDLTTELPLRAALYHYQNRSGQKMMICLLTFHHIVFDGWSLGVMLKDLCTFYQYHTHPHKTPPAALPLSYLDYALWQQQNDAGEAHEQHLAFWQHHLEDYQQLDIPYDYARPTKVDLRGDNVEIVLPVSLVSALTALARKEEISTHAMLLGGFSLMLARYTGQDDIIVGTPLANRSHPELIDLVGFFVNVLPLRNKIPEDSDVRNFLHQIAANTLAVQEHQEVSLEQLLDKLAITRDFSRHPLFQVMFALEDDVQQLQTPSWMTLLDLGHDEPTAKYDLSLTLIPEGKQMRARFNFATALFTKESITHLAHYYLCVLEQMAQQPELPLKAISLAPFPASLPQISHNTSFEYDFERLLHADFIQQARLRPDAVALFDEWGEMTYGELYTAAATLATQLRQQNHLQGDAIGILAVKGRAQPVAIFATLMCGKAFLPMDSAWPAQRRLEVLKLAGSNTLLSTQDWETDEVNVVRLNPFGQALLLPTPDSILTPRAAAANDLAYIIFTSGSTGTPKGVAIEHRSAVNMLESTKRYFSLDANDRTLALSALSFDLSLYDIFSPLSLGGACVIPAERDRTNPAAWYQLIMRHNVSSWLSAPAFMELLLDYIAAQDVLNVPPPALRIVMLGGDWIATALPERVHQWAPQVRFCSAGGATESAIFSILYEVPHKPVSTLSIPYGKPLTHQYCYILDAWLRPVPAGAKGEIFIAGEGLARGYYGDEQRTAERFFWHEQLQERVYRTGDFGRFMNDGNIEFMGRIDQQVKINGYRIELGEIENKILSYPGITACCVVVLKQHPVAWFVASDMIAIPALEQHLRQGLPAYMMPASFMQIDSLPLTVNGKIARDKLPEPQSLSSTTFVGAENQQERLCSAVWCEILALEQVSVEDNFFSLGGNSILAIKACYKLTKALAHNISVNDLGQHPTIRKLCRFIEERPANPVQQTVIPALHRTRYPLSSSQLPLWFIESLTGGSNLYHVPMLFALTEDTDLNALTCGLQSIVERHHILRSIIVEDPQCTAAMVLTDNVLNVPRVQCDARRWKHTLNNDIDRAFCLSEEIPIRAVIYQVTLDDGTIQRYSLIVVHHIAFDGWSQTLFQQELVAFYQAYCDKQLPALTLPEIQYGDYACWQRDYLDSPSAEMLKDYWRNTLAGWETLNMPLDFVRPAQFDHRGKNLQFTLPQALVAQAERFAQEAGVTPFALYLSAFNLLLSFFSNQQDIVVGTPMANRSCELTQNVIGFFVNTLPLRTKINDDMPLAAYVNEVFSTVMAAQKHQALPLDHLIKMLQVPHDISRNPLFQVMFLLEDEGDSSETPDWLIPQSLAESYQAAKFDLVLSIQKQGKHTQALFNYATALFSHETMACLGRYYPMILQQIVEGNDAKVKDITLVSPQEATRLRETWQHADDEYPYHRAIHHDFIHHVRHQPQATAIIDTQGTLTYEALYQAALRLSLQLRQHACIDAETIAVMVDKGRAQIIAVLAIVMAGKAYLPLDKAWPEQRRRDIITQSKTRIIISSQPWEDAGESVVLPINHDGEVNVLPIPQAGEPIFPEPSALAYVIFTSGSTGTPKGVAVKHSGAVNSIIDTLRQLEIGEGDRGLALSALSFDISAFDIFGLLSAGGTMVLPSEAERYQPAAWHRLLVEHAVTFWNSTPSVMTLLVEYVESQATCDEAYWPALRNAVLVGEVIPKPLASRIRRWGPDCRVVSTGGATESSIWSIIYDIPRGPILTPGVPYGKAMAHQRFYVLDRYQRLLPACMPGEQYIGGEGVAQGYYHNPDVTQEKFFYHPVLGERIYRTGDAGRYLPDGNLEFLGRMDFQVKINGYRVELQEIEHCALQFGAMKSCCAIVWKDEKQERLALYYVSEHDIHETQLLEFMSQRLPLYMIPTALIAMDALPYNSSGKLDRKALPAPQQRAAPEYVPPATEQEQRLCSLWQDILKRERIGMTDDFFLSGGTSILAISACLSMSRLLDTDVPVVKLFQSRNLKNLLAATDNTLIIDLNKPTKAAPVLWMIHPAMVGAEVFYPLARRLEGQFTCYGVDNYNLYRKPALTRLESLADRYLSEMMAHAEINEPVHILGWSLGGIIALEIAAKLEALGKKNITLYLLDSFYQQTLQGSVSIERVLDSLGLTKEAAARSLAIAELEETIASQSLSQQLHASTVTLFKATEMNPALPETVMRPLVDCADNGLGDACPNLTVIELNCHHHNILEQERLIIDAILAHKN